MSRHFGAQPGEPLQRSDEIATWVVPRPTFHEAGTWRGSDMAHAATIVASNTLRVHIVASLERVSLLPI